MKHIKVGLNSFKWMVLVGFLTSCGVKSLKPEEYVKWVENADNGLSLTKEFDDVTFQVLYKPVNYIVAKEFLNGGIKKEEVDKRIKELGSMDYYTLRIKSNSSNELLSANIGNESEYYQRLEYFMGPMQDDINLINANDTIPCALFHFERSYGLAPYNNFVVGFAGQKKIDDDQTFVFEDKILGTGKVMFKIKSEDRKNIPNIIWN